MEPRPVNPYMGMALYGHIREKYGNGNVWNTNLKM